MQQGFLFQKIFVCLFGSCFCDSAGLLCPRQLFPHVIRHCLLFVKPPAKFATLSFRTLNQLRAVYMRSLLRS